MTQVHLYQRAMQSLAQRELEMLHASSTAVERNPDLRDLPSSVHNMTFRRAEDGEHIFFGQRKMSIEDRKLSVVLHKNKQYQWLLAEAYEEFEDCLESVWAYLGHKNSGNWPLQDFGNILLGELPEKDYKWFEERARKKKGGPTAIINSLRLSFPAIKSIDCRNRLGINLYFAITLIEKIRHIVVHKAGIVESRDDFVKLVLESSGLYNSGNPDKDKVEFVTAFFGDGEYQNHIFLLEIPTDPEIPLDTHINLFAVMCGYMMAYIDLIIRTLQTPSSVSPVTHGP